LFWDRQNIGIGISTKLQDLKLSAFLGDSLADAYILLEARHLYPSRVLNIVYYQDIHLIS
jgi:hypothetical protein